MAPRAGTLAALALLAGGAACGQPAIPPCPGVVVGTFRFTGTPVDPAGGCLFSLQQQDLPQSPAVQPDVEFTAQVAFGAGGEAWVCPQAADASPLVGTHAGDHLRVVKTGVAATVPRCGCTISIDEALEGDLTRDDAGLASGFTAGLLQDDAVEQDPAGDAAAGNHCETQDPTQSPTCGVPCSVQWTVTGAP